LPEPSDEHQLLLATLPPSKGQIRLALGVVIGLLVALALTIPFTNILLPRVDAFIPAIETAIVFNDLVTAARYLLNSPSCVGALFWCSQMAFSLQR
jgi:two-component system sensor histidine kinase/response regulator